MILDTLVTNAGSMAFALNKISAPRVTAGWPVTATTTGRIETRWAPNGEFHEGISGLNTGNNAAPIIAAAQTACRSDADRLPSSFVTRNAAIRINDDLITCP